MLSVSHPERSKPFEFIISRFRYINGPENSFVHNLNLCRFTFNNLSCVIVCTLNITKAIINVGDDVEDIQMPLILRVLAKPATRPSTSLFSIRIFIYIPNLRC